MTLKDIQMGTVALFIIVTLGYLRKSSSMAIAGPGTCRPTGSATMGPYYKPDQPTREVLCGKDPLFATTTKLTVSGVILDEYCQLPVPGAKVEIWQTDSSGSYRDSSQCRSTVYSDCRGQYRFTTVQPGKYPLGRSFRPSHIHYMVTTSNNCYNRLVTQLYFEGE